MMSMKCYLMNCSKVCINKIVSSLKNQAVSFAKKYYLPNLASSSLCFFPRRPQMVAMTPCRLKHRRRRSTMRRQMKTPARASPIMEPLDNSCGGAYPERSTPVQITLLRYSFSKKIKSSRSRIPDANKG